jgi:glucosamine-phosphate N-acetyltransferase
MIYFEYTTLWNLFQENKNQIEEIIQQYTILLSQLTETTILTKEEFMTNLSKITSMGCIYVCYCKSSENKICIIGTGTIIIEPKLIRNGRNVGHIEDIVVDEKFRSMGVAKHILEKLSSFGNQNNCYKIILDANQKLCSFYEKTGFTNHGIQMSKYF